MIVPTVLQRLPVDGWLLFATRFIRLFAYGLLSVVLVFYLIGIGLSDPQTGTLLTLTLVGDTFVSLRLAVVVLPLRFSISQMDVPARQSYLMAVVSPSRAPPFCRRVQ